MTLVTMRRTSWLLRVLGRLFGEKEKMTREKRVISFSLMAGDEEVGR